MAEQTNPTNPIAAAATPRAKYTFTVPEKARSFPGDPRTIALQPITLGEEAAAEKRAEVSKNLGAEMLKASIVEVDGAPLGWENGSKERFLEGLSPAVRVLVGKAFSKLHSPAEEDAASFLDSMTVKV